MVTTSDITHRKEEISVTAHININPKSLRVLKKIEASKNWGQKYFVYEISQSCKTVIGTMYIDTMCVMWRWERKTDSTCVVYRCCKVGKREVWNKQDKTNKNLAQIRRNILCFYKHSVNRGGGNRSQFLRGCT